MRLDPRRFGGTLATVLPGMLDDAGLGRDVCILATRIGVLLAREHGLQAGALPVRVAAMNAPYRQMMGEWSESEAWRFDDYLPESERTKWAERGAWCVMLGFGTDPRAQRPGYDGHVVLTLARRWVVDLTIDQAARPDRGIDVEPLLIDAPDFVRGRENHVALTTPAGATAVYWHHDSRAYLRAADWTQIRRVDRFVRQARARVEEALHA